MRIISHRGNLYGPGKNENIPKFIDICLENNFDCEIDLWYQFGRLKLGHDAGENEIDMSWLSARKDYLWVHCKNSDAVSLLSRHSEKTLNFFWHEQDAYTLTSNNKLWTYPGKNLIPDSVAVLPELWFEESMVSEIIKCYAVCTDFPFKYKDLLKIN
jgi:hypothetical protein